MTYDAERRKKIIADNPKLYRNGIIFECNDGWLDIIEELSQSLEALIDSEMCCALQVKEKFGELRFYMSLESDEMSNLIETARIMSRQTCEMCGKPGKLTGNRWFITLCDDHIGGQCLS